MPFFDPIRIGASGAAEDFTVDRSLRFNDDDTAYLNRTPSSDGNRKTFTISFWIKRANLGDVRLIACHSGNSDTGNFELDFVNDTFRYIGWSTQFRITNRKFRDPSAWYHIVTAIDTTDSTADNRIKIYVNGVQETSFSSSSNPSQDFDTGFNQASTTRIGLAANSISGPFDGYMAEINFIDGQQYDASYFGETNVLTGQWNPKKYTGSYGTNGFYLNFSDNSGTSATTLGKDSSGNGNNFTPNNFVTGDAVKDSPTNNFCTLRKYGTPSSSGSGLAEGNLEFSTGSSGSGDYGNRLCFNTIAPTSGKWYAEVLPNTTNYIFVGVHAYQVETTPTSSRTRWQGLYSANGESYLASTSSSASNSTYAASYGNDVIGIYMDMDATPPQVYFSKNGQWANGSGAWNQSSPNGSISLGGSFFTEKTGGFTGLGINIQSASSSAGVTARANFGQDSTFAGLTTAGGNTDANGIGDFKYTVPTNALALCTANLPDPTILLPNKHFGTLLYSSGSSNGTFTFTDSDAVDFFPDWTWLKCRSASEGHYLFDAVRGNVDITDKFLKSNDTGNETGSGVDGTTVSSIQNGIKIVETSIGSGEIYYTNRDYVTWNWNAGDTDGKTYTVTVVDDSGNKYRFDGFGTSAVTLDLAEGGTYIFNYPSGHPFKFSTTADGTHGGGSEYTTGVTHNSSTQVTIVVAASAPQLYYYCSIHSGMGGAINTNSTLGSSNFDGSIQTTAKVNANAGFSIVTFSGSGNRTIGHGLGVAPQVIIMKGRNVSDQWTVGHQELDASNPWHKGIPLNTNATTQDNAGFWNDTAPTSTVFSKGTWDEGYNMVAYCFSEVAGYSKFGSYTGNGNSDGTFVHTSFRPAFIIFRNTSTTTNWELYDTTRPYGEYNPAFRPLYANHNYVEETHASLPALDILSNGFKPRSTWDEFNKNGDTIIYLAFAESPFKNARAR